MGCCGAKRQVLLTKPTPQVRLGAPLARQAQPAVPFGAFFEYIGQTALTAIGPATGKRYRFDRPGARLEVDLRDRRGIAAVPLLRQVPAITFRTAR
jgi:hypothetical protein